jgi:hypothetical protein
MKVSRKKPVKKEYEISILSKAPSKEEFDTIRFVTKGIIKKLEPSEEYKNVVHVESFNEKRYIVGTDGSRLYGGHIKYSIDDGDYEVQSANNKYIKLVRYEMTHEYPDWKDIIFQTKTIEKGVVDLLNTGLTRNINITQKASKEFEYLVRLTNKLVNIRFVDDLPKMDWTFSTAEKSIFVVLRPSDTNKDLFAVIMPIARKDDVAEENEEPDTNVENKEEEVGQNEEGDRRET